MNGNVFWYVYDNGNLCQTFAKGFFSIWNEADFDIRNFLSPDFSTAIQTNEDTTTVPYNDLVFDYKFGMKMCRIFKNGYQVNGNEYSLQFDGVDDMVTMNNNAAINNLDSFTISFWWYPTNFGPAASFPYLVSDNYSAINSFLIYEFQTNGSISFRMVNSTGAFFTATTTANALNTWYHVICKFNRVTGAMAVRINDVQRATATATTVTANVIGGAANILINNAIAPTKWAGKMDEFKLWRSELSDANCSKVYNGESYSSTPNYYLPMSVGIGTVKSNAAWDFVKYTNSLVGSSAQF